jgi:hypothetical protein
MAPSDKNNGIGTTVVPTFCGMLLVFVQECRFCNVAQNISRERLSRPCALHANQSPHGGRDRLIVLFGLQAEPIVIGFGDPDVNLSTSLANCAAKPWIRFVLHMRSSAMLLSWAVDQSDTICGKRRRLLIRTGWSTDRANLMWNDPLSSPCRARKDCCSPASVTSPA